ncbi:MAG: 23S rRNA (adenine(2503)-C(2))-methyltransferase RlmN [Clostridia bacterium]|nr:23S rRNA (adenine(2503)-C(2))-methyltransferase RlmN [Clostridia bacterium]
MTNLLDLQLNELEELIVSLNEPKFRAKQVYDWLYKGKDIDEMKNIPSGLKEKLKEVSYVSLPEIERVQVSSLDGTRKYLYSYGDIAIESVFMKYKFGNSICVSTQAGCRMGCRFCASTINGLDRNLSPGEIMGEILQAMNDTGERISHIVLMGTGEPFDNYENVSKFLRLVNSKEGLNIGWRNITVSTCGLVPYIDRFGDDFREVNLAISLHEPNDEKRNALMPVNRSYSLSELIPACRRYTEKTGRRITFEYTLVKAVNDRDCDAQELASLLKGMLCHVNLIPLNAVKETGFSTVEKARALEFQKMLEKKGIPTTIRREMGDDIDAACGQLRLEKNH